MNKEDWKREERLKIDVIEVWNEVQRHIEDERKDLFINKNSRWKTIRIFVSSTFKDFHTERDALVKEVFPELREWCQKRDLNLVECDLRWGVPEETPYCVTLQICLDEIRRCEEENKWPFFLNMISKRIGWIPLRDELPAELISDFNLVIGLSVTEMEIVEAAYRKMNPNSLFMWRDESFLKQITEDKVKQEFLDDLNPLADRKMSMLKQQIRKKYPEDQICTYTCDYVPGKILPYSGRTRLVLSPIFKEKVIDFFKERIEELYVKGDNKNDVRENPFDLEKDQHDAFMQQRAGMVVGRSDEIEKVKDYIKGNSDKPLVLLGKSGNGKSTVMAKVVHDILNDGIAEGETKLTYFHFVGAVPKSTSLLGALRRFLHTAGQISIPSKPNEVFERVRSLLMESHSGESTKFLIFIDALDQFDKDDFSSRNVIYSWLPKKLPPNVRCILSMIADSIPHKILKDDDQSCREEVIGELEKLQSRNEIISRYLINFRKTLDKEQTVDILSHSGSGNPLWLITACEELRYFGEFKNFSKYVKDLPPTLEELLYFVLQRICRDMEDKDLVLATLCLMECSQNGLLEVELLEMLAMMDTKTNYGDSKDFCMRPRLISWKWGCIYRQLKTFIRPYGDSGDGRLNYYHKSMSNVVRKKFLQAEYKEGETWEHKCHKVMAIYFETTLNLDRKIEEYPHHLIKLSDDDEEGMKKRLRNFLQDWEVIEKLFDSEWSKKLLEFWKIVDEKYESLKTDYLVLVDKFKKSEKLSKDDLALRMEIVARIFCQAGLEKDAMDLGNECRDILKSLEGDGHDAKMVDKRNKANMYICGFLAHLEVVLNRNYKNAISLHDKAIEYNEKLSNQHDYFVKRYKALQYNKKAFCMAELADNMWSPFKKSLRKKLRDDGNDLCMKAIKIYSEIKDHHHELDVMLTKATLCTNSEQVHEIYKELMTNCKACYGIEHDLMASCLYNDGTEYHREHKYDLAYNRYKSAYLLSKHLFGPGHRSTDFYLKMLEESTFAKIATKRKEVVKELNFDPDTLFSLDLPNNG